MPLHFILPLISSLLLYQSGAVSSDNQPKPYEEAEAYEVYSAILPTERPWRVGAKSLVIQSETKGYEMCLRPDEQSEKIIGQAISEYVKLNGKTWLLQRQFSLKWPYDLIAYGELMRYALEKGGWEDFYKRYPNSGGWIELSAVGFNADKMVAVVYMGHYCGGLCGGGGFHVLQKKDGKWAPLEWKGETCVWRS